MRLRLLLLKWPKRAWLSFAQSLTSPAPVSVQINNKRVLAAGNETVLQVARKNGVKIPYNCRAGICWSCECTINGKPGRACYTLVKDQMYVVEKASGMSHWRQNLGDE
jgi:ferredoxin